MKKLLLLFITSQLFFIKAECQLLTPNRAKHIKECTVRITASGSVGSGFLISSDGFIMTCWHVIVPSIIYDTATKKYKLGDIVVEFQDGTKIIYGIPDILSAKADTMVKYDMCMLVPKKRLLKQAPFLKIGNFDAVNDGDEIITCGYPFGMKRSFISRGMVGSKFKDTVSIDGASKSTRWEALLDITMNKGNSGGAIYKIGDKEQDDEVIGIADFIITPVGKDIVDLLKNLKEVNKSGTFVEIGGINPNATLEKVTETLTNTSDGVSGCISIQYFNTLLDIIKNGQK